MYPYDDEETKEETCDCSKSICESNRIKSLEMELEKLKKVINQGYIFNFSTVLPQPETNDLPSFFNKQRLELLYSTVVASVGFSVLIFLLMP